MINEDIIKKHLKDLVLLLVNSDYLQIKERAMNGRLTIKEIEKSIEGYPGKISIPPNSAYEEIFIYPINSSLVNIEFDLWYDNSPSDLTLSADIAKDKQGEYLISISDIHVL